MAQETTENWNVSTDGIAYPQFARNRMPDRFAAGGPAERLPETLQELVTQRTERTHRMFRALDQAAAPLPDHTTPEEDAQIREDRREAVKDASKFLAWQANPSLLSPALREEFERLEAHELEIVEREKDRGMAAYKAEQAALPASEREPLHSPPPPSEVAEQHLQEADQALDAARAEYEQFLSDKGVTLDIGERRQMLGDQDEQVRKVDAEFERELQEARRLTKDDTLEAIQERVSTLRLQADTLRMDVAGVDSEREAEKLEHEASVLATVAGERSVEAGKDRQDAGEAYFTEVQQDAYAWQYEPYVDLHQTTRLQDDVVVSPEEASEIRDQTFPGDLPDGRDLPGTILVGVAEPGYLGSRWQEPQGIDGVHGTELQDNRDFTPIGRSAEIAVVSRDVAWPVHASALVLSDDTYRELRRNHDDVAIEQGALTYLSINAQSVGEDSASIGRTAEHHRGRYPDRDFASSNEQIVAELGRVSEAADERRYSAELQLHLNQDESVKHLREQDLSPRLQHNLSDYREFTGRIAYAESVVARGEDELGEEYHYAKTELEDAQGDLAAWAKQRGVSLQEARVRQVNDLDRDGTPDQLSAESRGEAVRTEAGAELDAEHKWTVQRYDDDRGVYVDKLHTNDVLMAHNAFRSGVEYRVIDNSIKDYAADYMEREVPGGNAWATHFEVDLHSRSSFGTELGAAVAKYLGEARQFENDVNNEPVGNEKMIALAQAEREQGQLYEKQLTERFVEVRGPDPSADYTWRNAVEFKRDVDAGANIAAAEQGRYRVEQMDTNRAGDLAYKTTLQTDSANQALEAFRGASDLRVRDLEKHEIVAEVAWDRPEPGPAWEASEEFRKTAAVERVEAARDTMSYRDFLKAEEAMTEKVASMEARTEFMHPSERERLADHKLELEAMGQVAARDMPSVTGDDLADDGFDREPGYAAAVSIDAFNAEMERSGDPLKAERASELAFDKAQADMQSVAAVAASPRELSDRWVAKGLEKAAAAPAAEAVQSETDLSLKQVLVREAELVGQLNERSEAIADAVDRIRDDGVDTAQVAAAYEAAARAYAAATKELQDFDQQPTGNAVVLQTYREVKTLEKDAAEAGAIAANAALDGEIAKGDEAKIDAERAGKQRDELLRRHGLDPQEHPPVQRERNTIERGLSPEQIAAVMGKPLEQAAKAQEAQPERAEREGKAQAARVVAKAAQGQREGDNQVRDFSAFADAQAKDKLVPAEVEAAFKRDPKNPSRFLDPADPKRAAFEDKGNRLTTSRTFDDKAVDAMVETADARGWPAITVKGDEPFRRRAWIQATARGIEVKGYTPTEQDIQRADQLAKQTGHGNAIEKNETLEAFRASRDGSAKDKREAAQKHPELVNAFAFEQAARSFAKQRLAPEAVAPFVAAARVTVERDLAQGKAVPEIRRRQEPERRQDRGVER